MLLHQYNLSLSVKTIYKHVKRQYRFFMRFCGPDKINPGEPSFEEYASTCVVFIL